MRRIVFMVVVSLVALQGALTDAGPAGALDHAITPIIVPAETTVTCDGTGRHTARLYQTLLGRPSDPVGLSYWIEQQRRGLALHDVAFWMTRSREFATRFGSMSDRQYVDSLYRHVLGRPADAEGRSYWLGQMPSIGRHGVATWITLSEETGARSGLELSPICPKVRVLDLSEIKPGIAVGRTGSTVTVIADRSLVDIRAIDGPPTFATHIPGDVVINANWFTDAGAEGPVVADGVRSGGTDIEERGQLVAYRPGCGGHGADELEHVWQGELYTPGPCVWTAVSGVSLIHLGDRADAFPGIRFDGYTARNPAHSFIGFNQDEIIIVSTTEMTASRLADHALSLGATEGIMLDGGGSTQIATMTERLHADRAVPTFVTLTSRLTYHGPG